MWFKHSTYICNYWTTRTKVCDELILNTKIVIRIWKIKQHVKCNWIIAAQSFTLMTALHNCKLLSNLRLSCLFYSQCIRKKYVYLLSVIFGNLYRCDEDIKLNWWDTYLLSFWRSNAKLYSYHAVPETGK